MDQSQSILLRKYIDIFFRKKFFISFLTLLSLPVGLMLYLMTPKMYEATCLLSYQQQKINPNKMSPDVESRIRDIVSTITQLVTSRTNLEGHIKQLNLYEKEIKKLPMEDVVDVMRRDIKIQPSREGDTFKISYVGKDPGKVVKVTNALAAKFIEENLKYREERAVETSTYTNEELLMAKTVMDQKESAMRDYKLKHYNEMPDQRASNVSRLISLQEQYQKKQEAILELEKTRVLLQDQLNYRKKLLTSEPTGRSGLIRENDTETPKNIVEPPDELEKLRSRLENLLGKYTENHPEIRKIRHEIAVLEQQRSAQPLNRSSNGTIADKIPQPPADSLPLDKPIQQYESQMKNISLSIDSIRQEMSQIKGVMAQYEKWVEAAPIREAEWSSLTREYGELKRHYDNLVSQDLQANSMLNLERRQKGSQFKIEDSARIPEKPIKPNFLKIMALSLLISSGFAVGIVFISAFLDQSFRQATEIEGYLGVPVVSVITYIETTQEKISGKRQLWLRTIVFVTTVCLIAGFFYYAWSKGKIII